MTSSRRDFMKFVVAGSIAAGCPVEMALQAARPKEGPVVEGEGNEICHQIRDGHRFCRPPVSERYDIVIVGAGVSGLSAAFFVKDHDFLLLEKEPHWGGNAYLEECRHQAFATGAAFTTVGSAGEDLAKHIGLTLLPVKNPDGTILHGEFIADTWGEGIGHLPYPPAVRESFKKFRRDILAVPVERHERELDHKPFSDFCKGYAPEVRLWWDSYGPSNWGARAEETSSLVAVPELQHIAGGIAQDDRITLPGGLGAITKRLSEVLLAAHRDRMHLNATTVAVEPGRNEVLVTYLRQGELKTASAKAVVMATPKFITVRLVAGLPSGQKEAMKKIRYIPYPVVNLVFDKPVFNRGYDTWCPGNTFTDFIVADWVVRSQPGYKQTLNIATCYTPLTESERGILLTEEGSRNLAARVLRDFQRLLPGLSVDPIEVHIYRRGHPLYMSIPGNFTETLPAARHPLERIFFANTDSVGPISGTSEGILAARRAVDGVKRVLTGKPAA